MMDDVIEVRELTYTYPKSRRRAAPITAVQAVSFSVRSGELFSLLGPNGSGKSTLFRILSTAMTPSSGSVTICGTDLRTGKEAVRFRIGVVFQHPSLDLKLTPRENLRHQGHLYNLHGSSLRSRIDELLDRVGVADRADDLAETLSGGNQRRVELAKALLHKPSVLILDEPSTGLDPFARRDFATYLRELSARERLTVVLTTHLLDEAERSDRIGIMDKGKLVVCGVPAELKKRCGPEVIVIQTAEPEKLGSALAEKFNLTPQVVENTVRVEQSRGPEFIPLLVGAFPGLIDAVTLSRPTLEDVFIDATGHSFGQGETI
jgi:ABC-2 type transport system ATP-binding protein